MSVLLKANTVCYYKSHAHLTLIKEVCGGNSRPIPLGVVVCVGLGPCKRAFICVWP